MKLLLDHNLSLRLVGKLSGSYGGIFNSHHQIEVFSKEADSAFLILE